MPAGGIRHTVSRIRGLLLVCCRNSLYTIEQGLVCSFINLTIGQGMAGCDNLLSVVAVYTIFTGVT